MIEKPTSTPNSPAAEASVQPYLTKSEVAKLVRKTERTVAQWMKEGKLPYRRVGRSILFDPDEIRAFFYENFRVVGHSRATGGVKIRSRARQVPASANNQ